MRRTFVLPVFVLVVVFVLSGIVTRGNAQAQDVMNGYAGWMSQQKEFLKDKPLNEVTLLGSHDAATSGINKKSKVCIGYKLHDDKHLKSHPSSKDIRKFKCQSASIKDQLLSGVRYLDLRVAYQDGKYWSHHGFLSTHFTGHNGIFPQIRDFLSNYPDEILILNMSHFFYDDHAMTFNEIMMFYDIVINELPGLLIKAPPVGKPAMTMNDIWSQNGRIVLIMSFDFPVPNEAEFIWDHKLLNAHWWKQKNLDKLMDQLDSQVVEWKKGKDNGKLKELQAIKSSNNKIGDADATSRRVKDKLASDWKDAPISIIMVNDSVNSELMPLLVEKIRKSR